jgi:ApaG protein
MQTLITHGIKVSVDTLFEKDHSDAFVPKYIFTYFITIENTSEIPAQLLRRHWDIFDSSGKKHHVDGNGVIGEQPIIKPGNSHDYNSFCELSTDMGQMKGYYVMKNLVTKEEFKIQIPAFNLIAEYRLN